MDLATARRAGMTCIYAYDSDSNSNPVGAIGEERFSGGPKKISNGVFVKFPNQNVLAFQGTITEFEKITSTAALASVSDWLDNFKVHASSPFGLPGLVHDGFARQLSFIIDRIVDFIGSLSPADRCQPLIVTGHSQGGAIATIATKLLEAKGIAVNETYTFAAPRGGDTQFVNSIATPIYRFEFGCDVVPHVPMPIGIGGMLRNMLALLPLPTRGRDLMKQLLDHSSIAPNYDGAGTLFYSREYGQPIKKYADPIRLGGLYLERLTRLPFNLKRLVEDHKMDHYLDVLK